MTRDEFMARLEQALKAMPKKERDSALSYYAEYIFDAGPENEQIIFEKLGTPEQVAEKLLADSDTLKRRAGTMSKPWAVVLSILAAPIAIPLIAAGLAVFLAVLMVIFAVLLVALIVALIPGILLVAFFAAGAAGAALGVYALLIHTPTGVYFLGGGLTLIGLGGLVFAAYRTLPGKIARAIPGSLNWLRRIALWPFRRRRRKK